MKPNIELQIDELVLHGFPFNQRERISSAVRSELERLIAERGLPEVTSDMQIPRLDGGSFQAGEGRKPESVGTAIAASIYGALNCSRGRG